MGIAKLYGQKSSGTNINGILKNYYAYAGENINPGDLVDYINGVGSKEIETVDTVKIPSPPYMSAGDQRFSAVRLTTNKILIIRAQYDSGSIFYLAGVICTLTDTTLELGNWYTICSGDYVRAVSMCVLSADKVFIAFSNTSSYYLYAVVCDIDGTVIIPGTIKTIEDTYSSAGEKPQAVTLSSSKVFLAYRYSSSYYMQAVICTISGSTITLGTSTTAVKTAQAYKCSPVKLSSNSVFCSYTYGGTSLGSKLGGIVLKISGTTLTPGSEYVLDSGTHTGSYNKSCALSSTSVFVAYFTSDSGKISTLYGKVCSISDTTITWGSPVLIQTDTEDSSASNEDVGLAMVSSNILVLTCANDTLNKHLIKVCTISGNTFTFTEYTETNISSSLCIPIMTGSAAYILFVIADSRLYIEKGSRYTDGVHLKTIDYIKAVNYETQVIKTTSSQFKGVAKTSGIGGTDLLHKDLVSIYTLLDNLVVNGDFSNGLEGWTIPDSTTCKATAEIEDGYTCVRLEYIAETADSYIHIQQDYDLSLGGHKMYFSCYAKMDTSTPAVATPSIGFLYGAYYGTSSSSSSGWQHISNLQTLSSYSAEPTNKKIQIEIGSLQPVGSAGYVRDLRIYDLTAEFGAGNEPTKEWCDENL